MSTPNGNDSSATKPENAEMIQATLAKIDVMLADSARSMTDDRWFTRLGRELEALHAQMRIHHAISVLDVANDPAAAAPQLTGDGERLVHEHYVMMGHIDRLIRTSKSIAGEGAEDQMVFIFRVRELVAMIRRHEAEEKRLMYVAVWRDTGVGG